MIRIQTLSVPTVCPDCGSDKFGSSGLGTLVCYHCGLIVEFSEGSEGSEETVVATLGICPHCNLAGEIESYGGAEWCLGCGQDPNDKNLPSPALADLWHDGSGIQKMMYEDKRMAKPEQRLGKFLRTCCGPHCSIEGMCPQAIKDLTECYSQVYHNGTGMSKKSKKTNKAFKHKLRIEQEAIAQAKLYAVIQCAKSGWFEKVIYASTPRLRHQQSGYSAHQPRP